MPPVITILHLRLKGRRARIFWSIPAASFIRAMRTSICAGFGRNDVDSRSSADDSDVHGQSVLQINEAGDLFDLARQLQDCIRAFLEIEAGVGGLAGYLTRYSPTPLRAVFTAPGP